MSYSAPFKAYLWQITVATVFILIVLCALASFTDTLAFRIIGATSLSASTFILFTRPNCQSAHLSSMLLSYGVAIIFALLTFYVAHHINPALFGKLAAYRYEFMAAIVFGISVSVMLLCRLHHPPAVGLGVAIVINTWDLSSLWVIIGAIIVLALLKKILSPYLKSLV